MRDAIDSYLSLGSNLGDKEAHLRGARERLGMARGIRLKATSLLYRTAPVGKTDQDWFLNQVVAIETILPASELLAVCQSIERDLGRVRHERWGPRTLDIDILLYGEAQSDDPTLTLPHPRMLERAFVLVPLATLSPGLLVQGVTVQDHLARLPTSERAGVQHYEADRA